MRTIRQAAQFGSIPPQHQGKDRVAHNAITKHDPRFKSLKEHFDIMMHLGEVRATRVVATMVDGVAGRANRDDTTDMVYLPISMGYRNCYKRYMAGNGYKVQSNEKGAIIVEAVVAEGGERQGKDSVVSIATYFNFWKREYPHLKICRPAEDICGYCFAFRNRHRYLANHKYSQTVESGSDEMEVERTELDCLLENVGNMSLDEVPIVDVQIDAPEAASTPEEEERDQLLLVIGKLPSRRSIMIMRFTRSRQRSSGQRSKWRRRIGRTFIERKGRRSMRRRRR